MISRNAFARAIAGLDLDHAGRAIAFLWYYTKSGEFEERTAADLAQDLADEGFSKPHVTRLRLALQRSPYAIRGHRDGTFRVNLRRAAELDAAYAVHLDLPQIVIQDTILPSEWVKGTRKYLERLVSQINGSYQSAFYDACAVLSRRLMESLIIEVFIHLGRQAEIQYADGSFFQLDRLIGQIAADRAIILGRGLPSTMRDIKDIGDRAAHNRVYITSQLDIDTVATRYRTLTRELLAQSGIVP